MSNANYAVTNLTVGNLTIGSVTWSPAETRQVAFLTDDMRGALEKGLISLEKLSTATDGEIAYEASRAILDDAVISAPNNTRKL